MLTIAHLTDTHLDEFQPESYGADTRANWNRVLDDLRQRKIDRVVFGGDIGTHASHPFFVETLSPYQFDLTLGNHDQAKKIARHLPERIPIRRDGIYYFADTGLHRLIFLDSSTDVIGKPQLKWFESILNTDKKCQVFIHHPILPVDSPVDRKYPIQNRNDLIEIIRNYRKQVNVFCGHNHCEDETRSENISQHMTPAISYQIVKGTFEVRPDPSWFAYRLIRLDNEGMSTELIKFTK